MGDILQPRIPLESLDDTGPAGPYLHTVDDMGLRRICLEIIRMAVWDAQKSPKHEHQARVWLSSTGVVWIKALGAAMGLSRSFTDDKLRSLFTDCPQPELDWDEEEDNE